MGDKQRAQEHHASAAYHHSEAAHYHREASKHYQTGKDYAHAAHMALAAHGHAMTAIWHANAAQTHDENLRAISPEPFKSAFDVAVGTTRATETACDSASHHLAAADNHEHAAKHHDKAAEFYDGEDHVKAAYEASIAHGYARQAVFHGDEAARHYVEHYGKSGPTAEII